MVQEATQAPPTEAAKEQTQGEPPSMKALLEAGVHFGHQTHRWNPRMRRFIFAERNGIHIVDLQQTVGLLMQACEYVQELTAAAAN